VVGVTVSSLSSDWSLRPLARMAWRCGPRAISVTSSPAADSRAPKSPPMAPAPKTQILMGPRRPSGEAEALGEADALQLARWPFGDLRQQHDPARHLEIRQAMGDEIAELPLGGLVPLAQHHGGGHLLPQLVVGHGEGQRLGDAGMIHQHLVDLAGRDLLAAAIDDLLEAPADGEIALGIEEAEIAGAEPAVAEGLAIGLRIVGVAGGHVVAADDDLTRLARGEKLALRPLRSE